MDILKEQYYKSKIKQFNYEKKKLHEDVKTATRLNVMLQKIIEPLYKAYKKRRESKGQRMEERTYSIKDVVKWCVRELE
jgi:hypothetical protein